MIETVIERCAGIDVGKKMIAVCVMTGAAAEKPRIEKRKFGTTVKDLEDLGRWLTSQEVSDAVMESTGSYWKPIFNIIEERVRVHLANAQHVKNLRGHKTDMKDSQWLAHLLRHGMIRASFIPPPEIRQLRDLTRRRKQLVNEGTRERNRIQKILEEGNVKLGNVLSDLFGASGQAMLEALVENRATAEEMAKLAKRGAKRKIPDIIASLQDHRMTDHLRFMVRHSLELLGFLESQIQELDTAIMSLAEKCYPQQFRILQTLPGIGQDAAAGILAEIGADMKQFPTAHHLASWAGVCPGNNESAGIHKSGATRRGNPWLRSLLVQTAWAATRKKDSPTKARFESLKPRVGPKRAVVAVAHFLLLAAHQALTSGAAHPEQVLADLDSTQKKRRIRYHSKCLHRLGVRVQTV